MHTCIHCGEACYCGFDADDHDAGNEAGCIGCPNCDDEAVEHPYAQEWAGSSYITTESGVTAHISCSLELASDPEAMKALATLLDVAARMTIDEMKRLADKSNV